MKELYKDMKKCDKGYPGKGPMGGKMMGRQR
jgi:hypothetical protein